MRSIFYILFHFLVISALGQTIPKAETLSFEEYMGYVKKHHPIAKQANILLQKGEVNLLKARGGFDPKIEIDHDRKKFKGTEYFDQLNAIFKIPTWYGIELKAGFEENSGTFLNPDLTVPEEGLYSAGISFSLAQGLLINERMAALKKARFYKVQTEAERNLAVNDLLFEASKAYFKWLEASNERDIYERFLANADKRFNATKRSVTLGDKAAIDSIEAKIIWQNRKLNLEAAILKQQKSAINLSNYLWLNGIPMELNQGVYPRTPSREDIISSLTLESLQEEEFLSSNHPKIVALKAKVDQLKVDRFLKRNKLLPKVDLQYNLLNTANRNLDGFNAANYKALVRFRFPLFLRKERGELKLANLKLQETELLKSATTLSIQNKVDAVRAEIGSLGTQSKLISKILSDYETLLLAEERKFELGESSLFLINSREKSLIETQIKENIIDIKLLTVNAKLINALGSGS